MSDRIRTAPEVCTYADENHEFLIVEISIPGVPKENIVLKMHADSFSLSAPRDDIEYVIALAFCCPVRPEHASAKYENGLLKITAPFRDPLKDAVRVPIT